MRPLKAALSALMLLAFLPASSFAAPDPALERKVDELLAPLLAEDLISGSILIARDGEVLLAKGYGLANREYGLPNTPQTKFRLGSLTKSFTSAAVFLLAQDGKLAVEDSLSRFLPDWPRGGDITLHQLLSHTSGMPSYNNMPDYDEKLLLPWSIDQVLDWVKDVPLLFEPGADWAYSNTNYVLLAKVIEVVSGRPYPEFLAERIFEPLGMTGSGQDESTDIIPGRATGHGNDGKSLYQAPYRDLPFTSGAGSLYSTVEDLLEWDRALAGNDLLVEEWRDIMFTPVQRGYACGWFVREVFGRPVIEHGGAINGFLSQMTRFPEENLVVISLFNYETTFWRPVNQCLYAIALGEPYEPVLRREAARVAPEVLARYAGTYQIMPDHNLVLREDGGRLMVEFPDEPASEALAQSDTEFFLRSDNAMMQVQVDEGGAVSRVVLQQGANRMTCTPVP